MRLLASVKRTVRGLPLSVRRHYRVVSVIGALILFATFLVKDQLKESQKEALDEVREAESRFESELQAEEALTSITANNDRFGRIIGNLHEGGWLPFFKTIGETTNTIHTCQAAVQQTRKNLDGLVMLYKVIYGDEKESAYAIGTRKKLDDIDRRLQELGWVQSERPDKPIQREIGAKLEMIVFDLALIVGDVDDQSRKLLIEAHKEVEIRKMRYNRVAKLSYILYPLGWTVAFSGKILAPEKSELDITEE